MELLIKRPDEKGCLNSVTELATIIVDKLSLKYYAKDKLLNKLYEVLINRERYSFTPTVYVVPNYSLRESGYRHIVDVYLDSQVYLHIAYSPIHDGMKHNQVKVRIRNHVLYQNDWVIKVENVLAALTLEHGTTAELHIALDACGIVDDFITLYHDTPLKLVREGLIGKNENKRLSSRNGFHFNSKESDLYFSFYDKSLDYVEKTYIKEFHKLNNLEGNVQRIEMRTRKVSSLKMSGFVWQDLGKTEILLQIFKAEFQKRIAFKDTGKCYYDENRNKKYLVLHPFDFPSTVCQLNQDVKTKPAIESVKSKKNTVKNLFKQAVGNPCEHNILALKEMVEQNNLGEWFEIKRSTWGIFSAKSVELVISRMNNSNIAPTKSLTLKGRLLSSLMVLKMSDWRMQLLTDEACTQKAA